MLIFFLQRVNGSGKRVLFGDGNVRVPRERYDSHDFPDGINIVGPRDEGRVGLNVNRRIRYGVPRKIAGL